MPEVVGNPGILVNTLEPQEITKAMENILIDDALLIKLQTQSLERAKLFIIENSAKTIILDFGLQCKK